MNSVDNHFLRLICAKLKESRPLIRADNSVRLELINDVPFASIWFRTRGCRHDQSGGCTMCNYGASSQPSISEMVGYVRDGLNALANYGEVSLLVSPSGSMFDSWEVPEEALLEIFRLVQASKCRSFVCETRAETITEELTDRYVAMLGNKRLSIEIGLESADPWILCYCVNKSLSLDRFVEVIPLLHRHQVASIANIIVGSPFLSPSEAIEDAVMSVRWALSRGVDRCILFPVHVRNLTLAHWLWKRGLYSPPSLWSLVEVLARLGPELAQRVTISWYKLYGKQDVIVCSPSTCELCQPRVVELLDLYRNTYDFSVINELVGLGCECKRTWRSSLSSPILLSLKERVAYCYEMVGRDVLGAEWWKEHGDVVLTSVLEP